MEGENRRQAGQTRQQAIPFGTVETPWSRPSGSSAFAAKVIIGKLTRVARAGDPGLVSIEPLNNRSELGAGLFEPSTPKEHWRRGL